MHGMVTTQMHKRLLRVYNFGDVLVPYSKALVLQSRLASLCKRIDEPDSLVLLQVRALLSVQVPMEYSRATSFATSHSSCKREKSLNLLLPVAPSCVHSG